MHPIENIIQTAVTKINDMVDVNTIVGDAVITPDGSTIIPISKVGFGFVSGGGEYGDNNNASNQDSSDDSGKCTCSTNNKFAGGASAGVSIQPIGFVIVKDDCINMLNLGNKNKCESIMDSIPNMVGAFKDMFSNNTDESNQSNDDEQKQ